MKLMLMLGTFIALAISALALVFFSKNLVQKEAQNSNQEISNSVSMTIEEWMTGLIEEAKIITYGSESQSMNSEIFIPI
jgi:hypothetical protein